MNTARNYWPEAGPAWAPCPPEVMELRQENFRLRRSMFGPVCIAISCDVAKLMKYFVDVQEAVEQLKAAVVPAWNKLWQTVSPYLSESEA